jgi:hypothetical protein
MERRVESPAGLVCVIGAAVSAASVLLTEPVAGGRAAVLVTAAVLALLGCIALARPANLYVSALIVGFAGPAVATVVEGVVFASRFHHQLARQALTYAGSGFAFAAAVIAARELYRLAPREGFHPFTRVAVLSVAIAAAVNPAASQARWIGDLPAYLTAFHVVLLIVAVALCVAAGSLGRIGAAIAAGLAVAFALCTWNMYAIASDPSGHFVQRVQICLMRPNGSCIPLRQVPLHPSAWLLVWLGAAVVLVVFEYLLVRDNPEPSHIEVPAAKALG